MSHEYEAGTCSWTGRSSPNFVSVHAPVLPPVPVVEDAVELVELELVASEPVEVAVVDERLPPEPPVPEESELEQAVRPEEEREKTAREVRRVVFTR